MSVTGPLQNTDPIASSHEAEISGKANYEASEIRFDQILSLSSTPFWLASLCRKTVQVQRDRGGCATRTAQLLTGWTIGSLP